MQRTAIAIKEQDNVATAIQDIPAGQQAAVGMGEQTIFIQVTQAMDIYVTGPVI